MLEIPHCSKSKHFLTGSTTANTPRAPRYLSQNLPTDCLLETAMPTTKNARINSEEAQQFYCCPSICWDGRKAIVGRHHKQHISRNENTHNFRNFIAFSRSWGGMNDMLL